MAHHGKSRLFGCVAPSRMDGERLVEWKPWLVVNAGGGYGDGGSGLLARPVFANFRLDGW